jgi:hypothetical protein
MATPLYKKLKSGFSTYVLPSSSEDLSSQSENHKVSFSKFVLLNLNLDKMDLTNPNEFNTESYNTIPNKGELLINSLRNYVANQEISFRDALLNNNTYFYNPNEMQTISEKVFWKWLRKSGSIEFEPAIPNEEYIDGQEFRIDDNLPEDYFGNYLWKERSVIQFNITNIEDTSTEIVDVDGMSKRVYKIALGSSSNIKPGDTAKIKSEGEINIGFTGEMNFTVDRVETDPSEENMSKNNWVYILSDTTLIFNNYATATLELVYDRVVQYIGEIASSNSIQQSNVSYKEAMAYIPDQNGQTPDILFTVGADSNYSPGLQIPIMPSQDQQEIIGGELSESPIVLNPENYPGDQYAYFDVDQKYRNSDGMMDRRRGEYYGVYENNRNKARVAQAPYVYPEFDGKKLDGMSVDFNTGHYTRMNLPNKTSRNFEEFNSQSFNNKAPNDFEFNALLWFYEVENPTTGEVAHNLYGITFLNEVGDDNRIDTYKKLVSNGKQDGLSFQFSLNTNYHINNDNTPEYYDPSKTYNLYSFDLYNNLMAQLYESNSMFMKTVSDVSKFKTDIANMKTLLYTQTEMRDVNNRLNSLYKLLNLYRTNQIVDSDSIEVSLNETSNPPTLRLNSKDSRYGSIQQLPVSLLFNNENNTVVDYRISVPSGKDFMVNVINDDTSDTVLDKNLNIVLERDLDYKQTCTINIYPDNAKYNKRLGISMNTKLTKADNGTAGYSLFKKPFNLPIDQNLNPNVKINGIAKRWGNLSPEIKIVGVSVKKISDNYYVTLELDKFAVSSFKVGDVLLLENFNIVYNDAHTSDISGQYEIVGEIEDNRINFLVDIKTFQDLYDAINEVNGNASNTYELDGGNFTQPFGMRYNSGYQISITNIDRDTTDIDKKYLVEVRPLRKQNI